MRKIGSIISGCLTLLALLVLSTNLVWAQVHEYDLKAVYLERFARFVEWPAESGLADAARPFIIGVIGKNPFGTRIEEIYAAQRIKTKKISVRYISRMDEIDACHLLFISKDTRQNISDIVNYTKNKAILTVSDTKGYASKGVYINFYIEKDRLRFEINQSAVKKSKLRMSYMLMQHAKVLSPAKGQK